MLINFFQKVLDLKNIPRQGWKDKLQIDNVESADFFAFFLADFFPVFLDFVLSFLDFIRKSENNMISYIKIL